MEPFFSTKDSLYWKRLFRNWFKEMDRWMDELIDGSKLI